MSSVFLDRYELPPRRASTKISDNYVNKWSAAERRRIDFVHLLANDTSQWSICHKPAREETLKMSRSCF
ncbi:unnamed protein product [Leptosia nina]|uniref:Uncharacterized protein n=1 Tax=Leptosia nina TaxID=320188 RepID=A0AAV1J0Z6_9NEOP